MQNKFAPQNIPSIARVAAGDLGFLTLIQLFDGPERYGAFNFGEPFTILALHGLWRIISEPLVAASDQHFSLRHAGIIHAASPSKRKRYRMAFRIVRVTRLHVIAADRDRDLLALRSMNDG
jgi:hypothetical protein